MQAIHKIGMHYMGFGWDQKKCSLNTGTQKLGLYCIFWEKGKCSERGKPENRNLWSITVTTHLLQWCCL
jgi:hypothetical protein